MVDLTALAVEHPARADEIRKLIPAMEMMGRLGAKSSTVKNAGAADGSTATVFETVTSLADFRTVRVIARGGMGVVYEAVQISSTAEWH